MIFYTSFIWPRPLYYHILARNQQSTTYLGIGVTELDGNISFQLVLESNGLNSRDGSDS